MTDAEAIDVTCEVKAIVARLGTDERDLPAMAAALAAIPGIEARDPITLHHHEYEIRIGMGEHLRTEAELMARLRDLELAAAPEVVELLPTAIGYVMVCRYWACPGERLARVESTTGLLRAGAQTRFRRDLRVLADHGLMHPYARGYHHWLVSSETGTLVLDSWAAVRPCTPHECEELLEMVDYLLSRRSAD